MSTPEHPTTPTAKPSTGTVACLRCLGSWPWIDSPRDTWDSRYQATFDSETAARAYVHHHTCGRRFMTINGEPA